MTVAEMVKDISWVKAQWYECEQELARVKSERDCYKVALIEVSQGSCPIACLENSNACSCCIARDALKGVQS